MRTAPAQYAFQEQQRPWIGLTENVEDLDVTLLSALLAHAWGGGEIASADGMRFVVPIRTVHAGPNPKYFGPLQGMTWYNLLSDQFTGLNAIPVPGTLRDSLVLLAVVLFVASGVLLANHTLSRNRKRRSGRRRFARRRLVGSQRGSGEP